jgi:hypothetical protein
MLIRTLSANTVSQQAEGTFCTFAANNLSTSPSSFPGKQMGPMPKLTYKQIIIARQADGNDVSANIYLQADNHCSASRWE